MDNNKQTQEHIGEKKQLFYPSNENNSDIKFLFKKCDVPEILMSYWITIPEFVNKIIEVMSEKRREIRI